MNKIMKNISFKNNNYNFFIKLIMFILVVIIFYFMPYTHDDWAWGTNIGIDRLTSGFSNYNGRWAGNLLVILFTRVRVLKAIISALIIIVMIKLINDIINKKNIQTIYIVAILIMLMPYTVIAQSISWTSGFTNYVAPTFLIILYLYLNRNIFNSKNNNENNDSKESTISNKMIIPMLLLGFVTSLFMENLAIYNILLGLFILGYGYFKNKKINLSNMFYLIGSISGSILMFSNSAYHNVVNASDTYRTIEQGNLLSRIINTYFDTIYTYLFQNNLVLNILVGILALILIYIAITKKNIKSCRRKSIIYSCATIIIAYLTYIIFIFVCDNDNIFVTVKYKKYLEGIAAILYWISIVVSSSIIMDKNHRARTILYGISILVMTCPLFIVTPIGPRCFFATYIFFAMIIAELFDTITTQKSIDISKLLIVTTLVLITFFTLIFGYIYKIEFLRNSYIEKNKTNVETLYLPKLPFEKYMHVANPGNEVFIYRFKNFYKIDDNVKVVFIDYMEWKEKIKSI